MYISAVSDQTENEELDQFAGTIGYLNHRKVQELDEISSDSFLQALSAKHESNHSLVSNGKVKPLMTKANISFSEKEGWKGEISVSIDLTPASEDKGSPSTNSDDKSSENFNDGTSSGNVDSSNDEKSQ